jgi:hypothetical protein
VLMEGHSRSIPFLIRKQYSVFAFKVGSAMSIILSSMSWPDSVLLPGMLCNLL